MKRVYLFSFLLLLFINITTASSPYATKAPTRAVRQTGADKTTRAVKIYLVALDDKGKTGKKIGCDDSLVPVSRNIKANASPLKATIEELLASPADDVGNSQLHNFWRGENLRVKSASIRRGVATIHISGRGPFVAGICDEPRIEEQIKETARQFPNVKRVKVFVNNRTLAQAIR